MKTVMSILSAAKRYIQKARMRAPMAIIPLIGKRPLTKHGWEDASTDPEQVEKWWSKHPEANIGIATGEINSILVIDVDIKPEQDKHGDQSLDELIQELGELPKSWEATTGTGGRHLYFRYPNGYSIKNSASTLGKDIDVRANGGYIVAPPSVHPDTKKEYIWKEGAGPDDLPLAELPDSWIQRLENPKKKQKSERQDGSEQVQEKFILPKIIEEGQRNDTLFRYGASLRAGNISAADILQMLKEVNQDRVKPPLPQTEVDQIYDSLMSYPAGTPMEKILKSQEKDTGEIKKSYFHMYNQGSSKPSGAYDLRIFEDIKNRYDLFILGKIPYVYGHGVYKSGKAVPWLLSKIKEYIFPEFVKAPTLDRIYKLFLGDLALQKEGKDTNLYPAHWIAFKNGFYDPKEHCLIEHDPKYNLLHQLPYEFHPDNRPVDTVIEDWLREFIPNPDDREMLLEYCGYCMTRDTGEQKFMILYGTGGTGKSTLINLLEKVIGEENVSHISLRELNQRFVSFGLFGKLLNACADLETTALEDPSLLKKILGEDTIRGESKGKDAIDFRSYAKLIFSTNGLPIIKNERSDGFTRRTLVVRADVKPKKKDHSFFQKLESHMDEFIHLSVAALERMYARGEILESDSSKEITQQWREESDSVEAWRQECCTESKSIREEKQILYRSYSSFCDETGRPPLQKTSFYRAVRDKGFIEQKSNGVRYFVGLQLKEKSTDIIPIE